MRLEGLSCFRSAGQLAVTFSAALPNGAGDRRLAVLHTAHEAFRLPISLHIPAGGRCILARSQHPHLDLYAADLGDLEAGPLFAEIFSKITFGCNSGPSNAGPAMSRLAPRREFMRTNPRSVFCRCVL